ncbi:MAG: hypothetical protein PHU21_01060 [Elusimicrobia bacterium]|nr:hypothetical protein [Elusimicrobiota bacterium]
MRTALLVSIFMLPATAGASQIGDWVSKTYDLPEGDPQAMKLWQKAGWNAIFLHHMAGMVSDDDRDKEKRLMEALPPEDRPQVRVPGELNDPVERAMIQRELLCRNGMAGCPGGQKKTTWDRAGLRTIVDDTGAMVNRYGGAAAPKPSDFAKVDNPIASGPAPQTQRPGPRGAQERPSETPEQAGPSGPAGPAPQAQDEGEEFSRSILAGGLVSAAEGPNSALLAGRAGTSSGVVEAAKKTSSSLKGLDQAFGPDKQEEQMEGTGAPQRRAERPRPGAPPRPAHRRARQARPLRLRPLQPLLREPSAQSPPGRSPARRRRPRRPSRPRLRLSRRPGGSPTSSPSRRCGSSPRSASSWRQRPTPAF